IGWVDFCQTHPQDCQVATVEASALRLDAKIWTLITRLNRRLLAPEVRSVCPRRRRRVHSSCEWGVAWHASASSLRATTRT
ncbi:MAG: hypothetical protein EBV02_07015, partial [Actinobacteria bacterium]|nr:hypothetical protein [Actinomycetota bacterium]